MQKNLQREEAILLSLKKLDFLTRQQIQRLHDLGGERNARRVLNSLNEFLSHFRGSTGEKIYYLSKAGRERVSCEVVRKKTDQVTHYLMRNDAYIHYRGNEDWKNELKVTVPDVLTLIPDAYFRHNLKRHFLEIDHLQHMNKNHEKIQRYKKIKELGVFQRQIKYFPALIWVTMTEGRKKQLTEWCEGLEAIVHLWDDIK